MTAAMLAAARDAMETYPPWIAVQKTFQGVTLVTPLPEGM
jgi:hypothetical protein